MLIQRLTARGKVVFAAALVVVVAAAGLAYLVRPARLKTIQHQYADIEAVPANAPSIPHEELERILQADFVIVKDHRHFPPAVMHSFENFVAEKRESVKTALVNPGEEMSTDLLVPGIPNRRLRFAAINRASAVIVYEQGGFVDVLRVVVFDFQGNKSFQSLLNSDVHSLQDLRKAIPRT